jgi:signal transduction histidine kinase
LGVLTVLALIAPALYAYTSGKALPVATAVAISVGSAVLFLLVIGRLAGLVHALAASMNEVAQAQALRGELLRRTIRASESERTRLGIELHDGPVQGLTAVGYRLDALQRRATARSDRRDDKVQAAQDALSKQIATLRQMMTGLRPGSLVERGIEAMLRDYCASTFKGLEIGCRIHVSLSLRPAPEVEVMLCRVVEEAMANVVKHSCARHIDVSITDEDGEIHLLISDDGIGFVDDATAVAPVGLGVANMRERVEMAGGTFAIHGLSGAGVTIRAVIPKQMEREGAA